MALVGARVGACMVNCSTVGMEVAVDSRVGVTAVAVTGVYWAVRV